MVIIDDIVNSSVDNNKSVKATNTESCSYANPKPETHLPSTLKPRTV